MTEMELKTLLKQTRNNKRKFSKWIVILVILLNVIFTAAVLYVFLKTGNEPMTLVGSWFTFTTGELWMLSSIKKKKATKEGETNDEY